nr:cell division protein SepF [Streptococcus constellatus]
MSLKDRFDKFIDYFTEDGEDASVQTPELPPRVSNQSTPTKERLVHTASSSSQSSTKSGANENITRLHARQQELAQHRTISDDRVTINVRYPRKYEETTEIVDLLIVNESILIDFQYMTEVQARRCLDYLDGARYVLAGNIKKVASTMYLLTPINVVVNVEDLKLPEDLQSGEFDFDMKRR